jgi:hypothetical protein
MTVLAPMVSGRASDFDRPKPEILHTFLPVLQVMVSISIQVDSCQQAAHRNSDDKANCVQSTGKVPLAGIQEHVEGLEVSM